MLDAYVRIRMPELSWAVSMHAVRFTSRKVKFASNGFYLHLKLCLNDPLANYFERWTSNVSIAGPEGVEASLDALGISMDKWKATCAMWGLKGTSGNLRENLEVLEEWGVDMDARRKAVLETPLMLNIRGLDLKKKMEWMIVEMGFSKEEVREIVSCWPKFLVMYPAEDIAPFAKEFTRMDYSIRQVKEMILQYPPVLSYKDRFTTLRRVFEAYLNLHPDAFHAMVLRCPRVLSHSEACLRPIVECLMDHGFSRKVACFMIRKAPEILLLAVERVSPQIQKFEVLGLDENEVKKALQEYPDLLWVEYESRIQPTINWLNENLEDVKIDRVVKECPWLLLRPLEHLKRTYAWFADIGMPVNVTKQTCTKGPHVLAVDPRQLDRMLDFAKTVLEKTDAQVFESSSYFLHSFEKRILARVAWLDNLDIDYRDLPLEELVAESRQPFETKYWAHSIKTFQKKFIELTLDKKLLAINSRCYP